MGSWFPTQATKTETSLGWGTLFSCQAISGKTTARHLWARTAHGYISRCASMSTMMWRRGTPASSAWASISRNAAFSTLREAAFRIR